MVIKEEVYLSCFDTTRTLHIYLPRRYAKTQKRYPVFYMFDGHNLFYDEDATFGKSWGLKDFLDKQHSECIIVGIECNHEGHMRLEEFSPYAFFDEHAGHIEGHGKELMRWIVEELKPWIDQQLRTKPTVYDTGIGGSSMGGLMALYGVLRYPHVFHMAACLSPHLPNEIFRALCADMKLVSMLHNRIYISWGSDEFRTKAQLAKGTDKNLQITRSLLAKHCRLYPRLIVKGRHQEASWEKELPMIFSFLLAKE